MCRDLGFGMFLLQQKAKDPQIPQFIICAVCRQRGRMDFCQIHPTALKCHKRKNFLPTGAVWGHTLKPNSMKSSLRFAHGTIEHELRTQWFSLFPNSNLNSMFSHFSLQSRRNCTAWVWQVSFTSYQNSSGFPVLGFFFFNFFLTRKTTTSGGIQTHIVYTSVYIDAMQYFDEVWNDI